MRPTRIGTFALVLAGLVGTGVVWNSMAQAQQGVERGEGIEGIQAIAQQTAEDGRREFSAVRVTNSGNKRTIWMSKNAGSSDFGAHTFTAAHEMDVAQIVISNGTWAQHRAASFGFALISSGSPKFSASSGEFGTTSITLPLPVEIREGDSLSYGYYALPGESTQGFVEMTFIGTVPGSAVDSLSVH